MFTGKQQRKPMASAYKRLITVRRLRKSELKDRSVDEEMLSDKARIVTSTGFRRLQVKAQVFSLEQNAAVRSRLTHTLEVALYGEFMARHAADLLLKDKLLEPDQILPFVVSVENACLLHDLGNPPFGHLGEFAIRSWFAKHQGRVCERWRNHGLKADEIEQHFAGFRYFDGNPQTLRIVMRLQWWKDEFGLNLTSSLLAAVIKYLDFVPSTDLFCKKPGFFATEKRRILQIWQELGLRHDNNRPLQRHPLVFLMEASDDIAYCLSDIEDALEKGIITQSLLYTTIKPNKTLMTFWTDGRPTGAETTISHFLTFKVKASRWLIRRSAQLYHQHHKAILGGTVDKDLIAHDSEAQAALKLLMNFTHDHIQRSKEAIHVELSGFRIVTDLLEFFGSLIFEGQREFERLLPGSKTPPDAGEMALEQRMFALLPRKHLLAYDYHVQKNPTLEPVYRAHLIVDYITGMTDTHALKVFRMLRGLPPRS
jgi:dGTPase